MTARPKACRRFVQVITDRIQVQPPDTTHITRTTAHSPGHTPRSAYKTGRGVLYKSHINPGDLVCRLSIEETYSF